MKTAASRLPLMAGIMVLALLSIPETGFTREKAIETPFYQTDKLYIAPESNATVERWCKQDRKIRFGDSTPRPFTFIVRYTEDHKQRNALFAPSYEEFVLQHIVTAIKEACQSVVEIPESFHINFQMSNQKNESGHWDKIRDQLMFRYRDGKVIQTSYAPGAEMIAGKSTEEIEAMRNTVPKVSERLDTVVAKIGPFTIYPHAYPLCTDAGIEVDAVFDIPAEQRDDWIEGKYGNTPNDGFDLFFEEEILPALRKNCGTKFGQVKVHYFEDGSTEFWDMMVFNVPPPGYTKSKLYDGIIEIHNMNKGAVKLATSRRNKELFGECTDGPFCDKLGGIYFDAIYRNDIQTVQRINAELNAEYQSRSVVRKVQELGEILSDADIAGGDNLKKADLNVLYILSGKYMYDYSQYAISQKGGGPASCFRSGSFVVDTRTVTKVIHFENQYGIPQGSVGGTKVGARYRVNPVFSRISDRVNNSPGSGKIGDFVTDYFNLEKTRAILSGLEQVISKHTCESPEIRQFERNLASIAEHYFSGKMNSINSPEKSSVPETSAPQPVTVTLPAKSSMQETQSVVTSDGSADNSVAPTRNRQRIRSESIQPPIQQEVREQTVRNQRNRGAISPENQQAMMAEVKAVTEAMTKTQQVTIQEFVTRLKNAGSTAERTKITQEMRAFQESSTQELQKAMAEIQQRYQ